MMAQFLVQPDPIGRIKFKPIKIDIHKGVIKIVDDEIFYDFQINNTESVIVGTEREEVRRMVSPSVTDQNAAGGVLTAKQAPHRPGTAPAPGLRAGDDVSPLSSRPQGEKE